MNILTKAGLATLPLMMSFSVAAMDYSEPVLCAATDVHECVDGAGCERVLPEEVSAPTFFRVDLDAGEIRVSKAGEPTSIEHIEQLPNRLVMQGVQEGRGWTIAIEEETARLVANVTTEQAAIVIFGACTEL